MKTFKQFLSEDKKVVSSADFPRSETEKVQHELQVAGLPYRCAYNSVNGYRIQVFDVEEKDIQKVRSILNKVKAAYYK